MPGCWVITSQSFGKKYGIVLADIIINLLHLQFWEYSRHFLVTFEGYAYNIRVVLLLHFQYFQIIFLRYFRKYAEVYWWDVISTSEVWSRFKLGQGNMYAIFLSILVVLVILETRTRTRIDFDMEEELLSLIYLIFLYYVLVVLIVLVKSKVFRKFLKLFLWYTFGIYIWYIPGYAYRKKKSKKNYKSQFFLGQLRQLRRVFKFLFIRLKNTI